MRNFVGFDYPFGEESCEHELEKLKDQYKDFYYDKGNFHTAALDTETYIIIGRRGAGKTSLSQYFEFQQRWPNAHVIDVDEPESYDEIMRKLSRRSHFATVSVKQIEKLWEYIIWALLLHEYQEYDKAIKAASFVIAKAGKPAHLVQSILHQLLIKLLGDENNTLVSEVDEILSSTAFISAREKLLEITKARPAIIAVDTLERYDKDDELQMKITSALIQCADGFNKSYSRYGIHLKVFMSAEIFPYIREVYIENVTKHIRYPLYLYWTPKDILRLLAWRLHKYLTFNEIETIRQPDIDWGNFDEILDRLWYPYFGLDLYNGRELEEKTFPYLLRHTQMLPRQAVVICNYIAKKALKEGCFPHFDKVNIVKCVSEGEKLLADEIINSYAKIYPGIHDIIHALEKFPMIFPCNRLDKYAKFTAYAWKSDYSPANFRKLIAEIGIVGRVRHGPDERTRIVAADFEYNLSERLILSGDDACVIHPLFYTKLRINRDENLIVYPFPDHVTETFVS